MPITSTQGFLVQVKSPWLVGDQNADITIREELHNGTPELAQMEWDAVRNRMPILRHAAIDDVYAIFHTARDDRDLVEVYSDSTEQQAAWGRTYIQYIEGGELGQSTWTNPPREVYFQVTTTDLPDIEAWAFKYVTQALSRLANGTGVVP